MRLDSQTELWIWLVLFGFMATIGFIAGSHIDHMNSNVNITASHVNELEDIVLMHLNSRRRNSEGPLTVPHVRTAYITANGYYHKGEQLGIKHMCDTDIQDIVPDNNVLSFNATSGKWVPMHVSFVNMVDSVAGKMGDVLLDAIDIISGVFADARISQSSIVQHEAAIDHDSLLNYNPDHHRTIDDTEFGLDDLWSASKINTELSGKSDTGHGHLGSDITPSTVTGTQLASDLDFTGYLQISEISEPLAPGPAKGRIYKKTGNAGLFWKPDNGPDIDLTMTGIGEQNTASNIGTSGVGVFKQKTGIDLELKKINAGSSKVTITDDTINNEIDVDIVEANIDHDSISNTGTNSHSVIDSFIASKGQVFGLAELDGSGTIPLAQIPLDGSVVYQGTWNADTNTPTLVSSSCTKGYYYVVSVSGTTTIDGVSMWTSGDHIICNGLVWEKSDLTDAVSSVNGQQGAVVLDTDDVSEASNLYYTEVRVSANTDVSTNTAHSALTSGNPHSVTKSQLGLSNVDNIKNNYAATTNPGITDDISPGGYSVGSRWINTVTDMHYVCTDNTDGAAVWQSTTMDGDLSGPASSTDNAIVRFDGVTGKLVQDSVVTIDNAGNIATFGLIDGRDISADAAHFTDTNNPHSVTKSQVGLSNVDNIKNNYVATTNPTVTDDVSPGGYSIGSIWINTVTDKSYTCTDNTDGASVWVETTLEETVSNIGVAGVGVFKQKTGSDFELKKINTGSSKVTITDDTINNEIDIDVVEANINHDSLSNTGTNTHAQIDSFIASKGAVNGLATLDGSGTIPLAQIPLDGSVIYQGTWNAMSNTPTIASSVGTPGHYYVVSVTGSTVIDGTSSWTAGDHIIFNGAIWEKSDLTDAVSSVAGKQGAVTLDTADIISGTFADARISQSSIVQHQAAIDHDSLLNYNVGQHRIINDAGTSATELWSASKIISEFSSHTHTMSQITDAGTVATLDTGSTAGKVPVVGVGTISTNQIVTTDGSSELISVAKNTGFNLALGTTSGTVSEGDHVHDTSDITSGTFVDARISQGSVTQHQSAIDHNSLLNYNVNQHRIINDAGTSLTELWSASKISSELSGKSNTGHSHATSDITSGTFADARISSSSVTQHVGDIVHDNLSGAGTNTHAQIDAFIASKGANNGLATLDGSGTIPLAQIPLDGSVIYQGTWNANTNTPTLVSSSCTQGHYYVVSVSGTTTIDGISMWTAGDQIICNGAIWEKTDLTDAVSSVAGKQGAVTLIVSDITDAGTVATLDTGTVNGNVPIIGTGGLGNTQVVVTNGVGSIITEAKNTGFNLALGTTGGTVSEGNHVHDTSDITSGTFVDARISQGSVTQHTAAIDHNSLLNYNVGQHRIINDAGTSATELWSASKISSEFSSHTHSASDITTGTFANARISQSSVTQHQSNIDHNSLLNYAIGQHRIINDVGTSLTELWSASKISTSLAGKSNTGHSHTTSDITSGTFADARISQSSVTQHVGSLVHQSLSGAGTNTHAQIDTFIASKGQNNGLATLDGSGTIPLAQIPLDGSVIYKGTWNAATNTPTITSSTGTQGHYYVVSVTGTTNIDGITSWTSGDHIIFNGAIWEKSDLTDAVSSVAGKQGAVVLDTADITSGTFANGRISQSSVTQHESSIDHNSLTNYVAGQHRTINDAGTSTTDLWSASKISTSLAGKSNTGHVHATSDITSGTFADARISSSSIVQHQSNINHDSLLNYNVGQHRIINDVGTSATELWSASKISTSLAGKSNTGHTHTASDVGLGNVPNLKQNLAGTVAPAVTDDVSPGGYSVGSTWIDTVADKAYICLDNTDGAAVWIETTQSGGAGDFANGGEAGGAARTLGNTDAYSLGLKTNNVERITINSVGEVGVGGAVDTGFRMTVRNPTGTNGLHVAAGEVLGDIALKITDADGTHSVMEIEADQGYMTLGKTYAQTLTDNGAVYGVDLQHSGGTTERDFNTQEGVYRIAGVALNVNHLSDVDTTTVTPTMGDGLCWDGSNWKPKKHNLGATTIPTINDDTTADYEEGSMWIDTVTNKAYVCVDSTTGAAIWKSTTATGTALDWTGAWVISTAYTVDQMAENDGSTYICTSAHTSAAGDEPGVGGSWATYWDLVASKGIQGTQGIQGTKGMVWQGAWVITTAYSADDTVDHNGASYICTSGHTSAAGDEPLIGGSWATYWDVVAEKGDTGSTGSTGSQGIQGIQGTKGMIWQGAWVITTAYSVDDTVDHNGASYICTTGHTSAAGDEPLIGGSWATYWDIVAEKGDTGSTGPVGMNWIGSWVITTAYSVDDAVTHNGASYICTTGHTSAAGDEPLIGGSWATYWDIVAEKGDTGVTSAIDDLSDVDTSTVAPANGDHLEWDGTNWVPAVPSGGSITNQVVSATADTSTTSATYVLVTSMTATPVSGTYMVTFSASGNIATGSIDALYAIYSAGAKVTHSERNLGWNGGGHTNGYDVALHSQAIVTVNGAQAIEVKYLSSGAQAFTIHERSLILIKLS